jgi:hypothetical protein
MILVYMAVVCSALAFLSGIIAVGSGHDWHFTTKDIIQGKQNAVLYVWVMFSSIFSLAHLASLAIYGIENSWGYRDHDTGQWMAIHTSVGVLLIAAHLFIKRTLTANRHLTVYVWGPPRVSE